MKKKEVIIGIAIAIVILVSTLIIHFFIFTLSHVLVSSLVVFSAMLFTLCIIGEKKRKEQEESKMLDDK